MALPHFILLPSVATRKQFPFFCHVTDLSALSGPNDFRLVNLLIIAEFYDMAFDLLRRYPNLAIGRDDQEKTALENSQVEASLGFVNAYYIDLFL
ncbi:uncharacterized protein LOC110602876 isoform X2 [Manihot esculenta]|uniref:uncharacterized protein LOC110602876 isoform X2 n=1 Tax=Manihot esculenta TaxID=3983 RepID=UPI001CC78A8A|nr:uncharacterized protein LOC110602876 isoform X2 [Manihot esculenta]